MWVASRYRLYRFTVHKYYKLHTNLFNNEIWLTDIKVIYSAYDVKKQII
jgi:hypothetical protein